jgi:type IV secretory pathway TraG/TraD family ATPase VirD4
MSATEGHLAPLPAHPAMLAQWRASDAEQAKALLNARVAWGGLCPPLKKLGGPHFFIIGETGSGKSNLLKLLMYSVLSDSIFDLRYRALVFDPKSEFIPFLVRCGIPEHAIILTNPFDARSAAWDISADVTNPADAEAFAASIAPRAPIGSVGDVRQQDFWNNAANQILRYVVDGLNVHCPGAWDLRDVVLTCMDQRYLKSILKLTYAGQRAAQNYLFGDKRLADSVLATLDATLAPLELVANLWHHARSRFSIRRWVNGSGVLLLSGDPAHADTCASANNLMVRWAIQSLLSKPEDANGDYTWFFLDELREAGRFPRFSSLMNQSRSKGGRVVLATQNKSGLNAAFGKDEANEVVGACDNQIILALGSEEDAKWASSMFSEAYVDTRSTTVAPGSISHTTRDERRPLVPAIAFRQLPLASQREGAIKGYGSKAGGLWYEVNISKAELDDLMPPGRKPHTLPPTQVPRDPEQLKTQPWINSDLNRLGLASLGPASSHSTGTPVRTFKIPPSIAGGPDPGERGAS